MFPEAVLARETAPPSFPRRERPASRTIVRAGERRAAPLLAFEPPLLVAGQGSPLAQPGSVNFRWLAGTAFAGLGGAVFLALAIYHSVDREPVFAERPRYAASRSGSLAGTGRKGDKLVVSTDIASNRQDFKAPVAVRAGEREIVRARAFVRVESPLSVRAVEGDIPPFNPLRLVTEEPTERAPDAPAAEEEADVAFRRVPLAGADGEGGPVLAEDDVAALAAEVARQGANARRIAFQAPFLPDLLARRPALGGVGPEESGAGGRFSTIDVQMAPENVTVLDRGSGPPAPEDKLVTLRKGERPEAVLRAHGATEAQARQIVAAFGTKLGDEEGRRLKLLVDPGPPAALLRASLYGPAGALAHAAADDAGAFAVLQLPTEPAPGAPRSRASDEDEEEGEGPTIYESLYGTALRNGLPRPVIEELVRVFAYDVDFGRRAAAGDSFEVLLGREEDADPERGELMFASLTTGGETRRFYRYALPDDGTVDWFDEAGRSAKKFLIRKPLTGGQLRSGFGYRRHPVLGYSKMHTGVDWADPIGTPIFAAGNGTVIKAGWDSGYGRRVEIQHANGYVTTYNHQSGFARGVAEGAKVRQGQLIGYIGTTGLSTGPHLHYEVIVNGHYVDPLRIRLPRGRELDGRVLADFKRERERADGLLQRATDPARVARNDPPR